MKGGRESIQRAKAFYQGRRKQYRSVMVVGPWTATMGQAGGALAGMFASFMVHAPVPLGMAAITACGLAVGSFFFPKPLDAGPKPVTDADLEAMTRTELVSFHRRLQSQEAAVADGRASFPDMPSSAALNVLRQQANAAKTARKKSPGLPGSSEMPLADLRTWIDASNRHDSAVKRWSQYELDPEKQIRFPAMTDTREAPTAVMIRAMKQAREAREGGDAQHYAATVHKLTTALDAAEAHAKAHELRTDHPTD